MTIFDWINQINYEKRKWDSFTEDEQKTFSTFIINRWLSMDEDLIQVVNYFQKYSVGQLQSQEVYKWYCDIIPRQKRFNKYIKAKKSVKYDKELIETVCKYYENSKKECIDYIELLSKDGLKNILEMYGMDKKQTKKLLRGKK
jgi:hypothetical protein